MAESDRQSLTPTRGGPARRAFHALLALAGWVLFVYWWWLVFRRVSAAEIRFTLLFIAIALAAIVALTAAWAIHNVWIYRRRGPRRSVKAVDEDFARDTVGREVLLPTVPEICRVAAVVSVRVRHGAKVYATGGPAGRARADGHATADPAGASR